jgi:membrane protein implicated in regulation of membrane protease activity
VPELEGGSSDSDDAAAAGSVESSQRRVLIFLAIALLLVLPSPWNVIAFLVLVPLWVLELVGWSRTVKHRKRVVGAQTLIGRDAIVIASCRPRGQVRLDGEIWEARCDGEAMVGDRVGVVGRDGLTLVVRPAVQPEEASIR